MGRRFADESVKIDAKWLPYKIKEGRDNMADVEVDGKPTHLRKFQRWFLQKIKVDAEAHLGEKVRKSRDYGSGLLCDAQRQATKQATAKSPGGGSRPDHQRPTAAALAYGLDKQHTHTIAVYDLGGGTFDITVLELGEGVFQVKATNGDTHLGGDDFEQSDSWLYRWWI